MQTPWKPIFGYRLSDTQNSQKIYDEIFRAALTYKFADSGLAAFRVDGRLLTDAIFDLNSHDRISVPPKKEITGQQLKELFVTTVFLKTIENKIIKDSLVHVALPLVSTSVDTAVIVSEPSATVKMVGKNDGRLSSTYAIFPFQIKEYVDHQRLKKAKIFAPEPVDVGKLTKLSGRYSEFVLVYLRAFTNFSSGDVDDFFERNPNCHLIHAFSGPLKYIPSELDENGEKKQVTLYSKPDKHNYVVVSPNGTFSTLTFDTPSFLVAEEDLPFPFRIR
jgi:hypothetical protein